MIGTPIRHHGIHGSESALPRPIRNEPMGGPGWIGDRPPDRLAVVLYTGVVLALAGLSWFTLCEPRSRPVRTMVGVTATTLALAMTAGAAHATVLRPPVNGSVRGASAAPRTR